MIRPATDSGRSNHVFISIPPYFSVSSTVQRALSFSACSLIWNVGLSLCAAASAKPVTPPSGTRNASSDESFRVTTYRPPGRTSHAASSASAVYPSAVNRFFRLAVA